MSLRTLYIQAIDISIDSFWHAYRLNWNWAHCLKHPVQWMNLTSQVSCWIPIAGKANLLQPPKRHHDSPRPGGPHQRWGQGHCHGNLQLLCFGLRWCFSPSAVEFLLPHVWDLCVSTILHRSVPLGMSFICAFCDPGLLPQDSLMMMTYRISWCTGNMVQASLSTIMP